MERVEEFEGFSNTNVSNPERWISVVIGAAIATFGLTRRSASGIALAALGGALVWRGASGHCLVYDCLGVSTASDDDRQVSVPYGRGIRVEKAITIEAEPPALYSFWRNLENLPRFMSHLESVKVLDGNKSHWVARGPAGTSVEWDAEIINEVPNQLIGWRSLEPSQVDHAGSVHFRRADGGRGTEVRVILRYDPPGGKVGGMVAKLLGEEPDHQIGEDLRKLKDLIETGKPAPATVS
ncbi:MAG TPA: SRPBCC family protein [Thermoanaerobaculia bacterium]|nr:SRPBCC family protein [Thermoanaerobaculia bacterium]